MEAGAVVVEMVTETETAVDWEVNSKEGKINREGTE
jgi:hypothetical protein